MTNIFDEKNEVKSLWVKWGKINDQIFGTFIASREIDSQLPGKEGEKVKLYEILAEGGEYHELDKKKNPIDPAVKVQVGEVYFVGGKMGIDAQMRRVKVGQRIGMRFTEEKESNTKGFNALKIIKVFAGDMNKEWLANNMPEIGGQVDF